MKNKLYLMIGVPGSGKSHWAKHMSTQTDMVHVSRDAVRYAMLEDGESYFSREKDVFRAWIGAVQVNLDEGKDVIADATHLSAKSRAKTLNALKLDDVEVVAVIMLTDRYVCEARNENRTGREKVPKDVMDSMYRCFQLPNCEREKIDRVWRV